MKKLLAAVMLALVLCGCAASAQTDAGNYVPPEENRLTVFTCLEESVYTPLVKENGCGIYLLTNASLALRRYFRRIPGSECFDGIVVSAEE